MSGLSQAIAECLSAHAKAVDQHGTDQPELANTIPVELRNKIQRQRAKVSATLEGVDPDVHALHVAALTKGLKLVLKRLSPCS
jgi:hypothetical protein